MSELLKLKWSYLYRFPRVRYLLFSPHSFPLCCFQGPTHDMDKKKEEKKVRGKKSEVSHSHGLSRLSHLLTPFTYLPLPLSIVFNLPLKTRANGKRERKKIQKKNEKGKRILLTVNLHSVKISKKLFPP